MALDSVLADAGTASAVTPTATSRPATQTAGTGSTPNVVVTSRPSAIDPGAVDAVLGEGLSLRPRGIAVRPGQSMKWSL